MSNLIGEAYRVLIFGQSHAPSIGAVIEGLPAGFAPDWDAVRAFMARRAPGGKLATARRESDLPEILSGLNERGETCGAPLAIRIANSDAHSGDYALLRDRPRPGHADYPASVKFSGANDIRGGGQYSGRLTAPLCFAGALALQRLEKRGVRVRARIARLAGVDDAPMDWARPQLDSISDGELATVSPEAAEAMRNKVLHLDREDVELPEDLVFIQDILGFKVFDLRVDRVIGRIRDVLTSNPAHDMYEIAGEDGRLIYIPAIKPFLKEIDMEAGVIYVESIEGLIE